MLFWCGSTGSQRNIDPLAAPAGRAAMYVHSETRGSSRVKLRLSTSSIYRAQYGSAAGRRLPAQNVEPERQFPGKLCRGADRAPLDDAHWATDSGPVPVFAAVVHEPGADITRPTFAGAPVSERRDAMYQLPQAGGGRGQL